MSVAVCRGPAVPAFHAPAWLRPAELYKPEVVVPDDRPAPLDIWNALQAGAVDNKVAAVVKKAPVSKPYVNPGVRRSMSEKSLQICTESLGCETGSGDFTASLDAVDMSRFFGSPLPTAPVEAEESFWQHSAAYPDEQSEVKAVNYHSSGGRRSPPRSFPPPLPSMSGRDGPCLKMCSRRQDGRLVVEAVVVRPRGYLQANREGGRLFLSFIECSAPRGQSAASNGATRVAADASSYFPIVEDKSEQEEEVCMEVDEEEDEEEMEVVDRGTVVEVKVSSQPQAPASAKVHRSTLVINKFVGSTPFTFGHHADAPLSPEPASARDETAPSSTTLRRVPSSTTLAAAVAVASTETGAPPTAGDDNDDEEYGCGGGHPSSALMAANDTKQPLLLFTSRRGDKHDLLQSVRRCRQLRQKPLFILEPYCIAT